MSTLETAAATPGSPPDALTAKSEPGGFRERLLPWTLITLVTLYCHGFILTNDGLIWDGWYYHEWLSHRNWAPMVEYTSAQGMPFSLWLFVPYAYLPSIVPFGMGISFACLLAEGFLLYEIAIRLTRLSRAEALCVILLAQAMPLFSAAQDFPVIGLIFFRLLFYVAALLATLATDARGWRHGFLRVAALLGFYFSCTTNGALLPYYGGFYFLILLRQARVPGMSWIRGARQFLIRYPDYFLLPPAVYAARRLFIPQFGWYETYNMPRLNLHRLGEWSLEFFQNVIAYHALAAVKWFPAHPVLSAVLIAGVMLWCWKAPPHWRMASDLRTTLRFAGFGALLLFLVIFPLAAIGKEISIQPISARSRHCLLAGLPVAVLLFSALRFLLGWKRIRADRLLPPIVGALVIVLGGGLFPIYFYERLEWILSRSLLQNAARNNLIRDSSAVVLGNDYSVVREPIYGTYAFAGKLGGLTRLVTSHPPFDGRFFTPSELEWELKATTVLPNELRRVDPSGQQIFLEVVRPPGGPGNWELVSRYLKLRFFGSGDEMKSFLASLVTLKPSVIKPATPLIRSPLPDSRPKPVELADGAFINENGMAMVRLPSGWWAAKYEATQAEYERVMGGNPSLFKDPIRPVECVSWNEATEFCRRLTQTESAAGRVPSGFVYRLPSVKEFDEMAGQALLVNAVTSVREFRWHTAPVGSLPPNPLGLHDVIGNVWEWCLDWKAEARRFKVSKGGSWSNEGWSFTAFTDPTEHLAPHLAHGIVRLFGPERWDYPDQAFWNCGFRCILAPPEARTSR